MKKIILMMLLLAGGLPAFSQMEIMGMVYKDTGSVEKNVPVTIVARDSNGVLFDSTTSVGGHFDIKFSHNYDGKVLIFLKANGVFPEVSKVVTLTNRRWLIGIIIRRDKIHLVAESYLMPDVNTGGYDWVDFAND